MHSSAIVQNILNIAIETAEEYDALNYIFNILSKDTLAENAELIINETDVKIKCYNCDYEGPVNNVNDDIAPMVFCPECGSHRVNVLKGYDLNIGNITIEKP